MATFIAAGGLQATALSTPAYTPTETATSVPTLRPSPTNTLTSTPAAPMVSVTVDTNCRRGPGLAFAYWDAFLVGMEAEVIGVLPARNYYYIRNPGENKGFCWLWGEYASVTGELSLAPALTSPPTPTPTPRPFDVVVEFVNRHDCSGTEHATMRLVNISGETFESIELDIFDLDASTQLYGPAIDNAPFLNSASGCPSGSPALEPDQTKFVAGPIGSPPPTGNNLRVAIKLCTEDGLGGSCLARSIQFVVP